MTSPTPLVIFGAGGFAREVLQVVLDLNAEHDHAPPWLAVGFLVDEAFVGCAPVHGLPVLGTTAWLKDHPEAQVVVAVGSSGVRRRIVADITRVCSNRFATLVHPRAWVGRNVKIGAGSVVCAGSQVTTDILLGDHVHVNIGSTIGHDAVLEDFVTLNPRVSISGNVTVGEGTEVGTGAVLIPHAHVGAWSVIGAGSVVTNPVAANVTAVGAPARVIKSREPGWQGG